MTGTRTRTVLFTDIVGSTELFGGLTARERERLLSAHLAALRDQIIRFGGSEVKNLGDGEMATFEAAGDAVACAVAIQQCCSRPHPGTEQRVPIRVGVSSGDVRMDGADCFGTAVVEASRLCAQAQGDQVLVSETTRLVGRDREELRLVGDLELKGLAEPVRTWEAEWSPEDQASVRVVLADDAALVREGVARVLEEAGMEVVGQAADADELLEQVAGLHPDVAITDVRMPPTHTTEGLDAAIRLREEHPNIGVLVLSQDIQSHYATRLLAASPSGVGYLLKERVANLSDFADAVRRVAADGTAFEPHVITSMVGAGNDSEQIRELTAEEAQTLAALAPPGRGAPGA
jgi:class 3 adenylate cyclase/DNA-binding NarL/FixJ family response regulator